MKLAACQRAIPLMLGISALILSGCGGMYDATVNGIVTLDGKPLSRGTVTFLPQAQGPAAYSLISGDGAYSLRTGREDGLPAGEYVVTVAANEPPATSRGKDGGPPPLGKSITPEWYRDPSASGLSYTVQRGSNEIKIELTSTPPPGWKPPRGPRR